MTTEDREQTLPCDTDAEESQDIMRLLGELEQRVEQQMQDLAEFLAHHRKRTAGG